MSVPHHFFRLFRRKASVVPTVETVVGGFYSAPAPPEPRHKVFLRTITSKKFFLIATGVGILAASLFFVPVPGTGTRIAGTEIETPNKTVAALIGGAIGIPVAEPETLTSAQQDQTHTEAAFGEQAATVEQNQNQSQNQSEAQKTETQNNTTATVEGGNKQAEPAVVTVDYLHGASYLRGVNAFSLFRQRNSTLTYQQMGEPESSYTYLASKGHKLIRLGVSWARLQPDLQTAKLNEDYVAVIDREVAKISKAGMYTLLDLHNGGTYPHDTGDATKGGVPLSQAKRLGAGISEAQAKTIWRLLSNRFKRDTRIVAYELFNEPWANDSTGQHAPIDPAVYRKYTNSIVQDLRANNDTHVVWVGSMIFSTRDNVSTTSGGDGVSSGKAWVADPLKKTMYTQHFYAPTSGEWGKDYTPEYNAESPALVEQSLGRIRNFAGWCKNNGVRCSIGELGWPGRDNYQTTNCTQPSNDSAYKWNRYFGEQAYSIANSYKLDVTYFSALSVTWPCEWRNTTAYAGSTYFNGTNFLATGLNHGRSQNTVLENPLYRTK